MTALKITVAAATVALGVTACDLAVPVPQTCEAAIGLAFLDQPVATRVRMQRIAWRESRNNPTAKNRRSSATGCLQLLKMHEPKARSLGYSWADMTKAWPNVRVARILFNQSGFRPWAATA
jgi:hypothetical protein